MLQSHYGGTLRMKKLQYRLTNDILFKMLFVKYPDLLKRLVAELLSIEYTDIEQFDIRNPEMPPEAMGDKFCRLDINMMVNNQRVDLEIQVEDEGNYPERSLFIWAREFSTAISTGQDYALLPRTIIISILCFRQFTDPDKFHSEFQVLEVTNHEPLTDKCVLHFFELPKLSEQVSTTCRKELWLKLFKAETEEDLVKIEALEVPIMSEAVKAYRHVSASAEFRERERLWSKARHDEAQALRNVARLRDEHWQGVVAEKDATLAEKDATLAEKDVTIANKDATIADKDAIIAKLQAQISNQ